MPNDTTPDPVCDLPFVIDQPDGRRFWNVNPTGHYANDCATGASFADAAINHMVKTGASHLLGWIVKDMHAAQHRDRGIEIGFLGQVARHAMIGVVAMRELRRPDQEARLAQAS